MHNCNRRENNCPSAADELGAVASASTGREVVSLVTLMTAAVKGGEVVEGHRLELLAWHARGSEQEVQKTVLSP